MRTKHLFVVCFLMFADSQDKRFPCRQSFTSGRCHRWTRRISKQSFLGQTLKVGGNILGIIYQSQFYLKKIWASIRQLNVFLDQKVKGFFIYHDKNRSSFWSCDNSLLGQPLTCWRRCWRWMQTRGSQQRRHLLILTLQRYKTESLYPPYVQEGGGQIQQFIIVLSLVPFLYNVLYTHSMRTQPMSPVPKCTTKHLKTMNSQFRTGKVKI